MGAEKLEHAQVHEKPSLEPPEGLVRRHSAGGSLRTGGDHDRAGDASGRRHP